MDLTKNDYSIIDCMYKNNCLSKIYSYTQYKIAEETGLSIYKIRASMKLFSNLGIVEEGAKDIRSKTYYLSEKGIEIAEKNRKDAQMVMRKIKENKRKDNKEEGLC